MLRSISLFGISDGSGVLWNPSMILKRAGPSSAGKNTSASYSLTYSVVVDRFRKALRISSANLESYFN
jgi:hypothetical protein